MDAFPRGSSNYCASPVITGGILYAAREDGVVYVAGVENGFELLAEDKRDDRVIASFVLVTGRLYVRGEANLCCVAAR